MQALIRLINKQISQNFLILKKLNRIYAHLEVEWDSKSFKVVDGKYRDIEAICVELQSQDEKYLKRGVN